MSDYQDATQKLLEKLQEGFKPPSLLRPAENDNPKYFAWNLLDQPPPPVQKPLPPKPPSPPGIPAAVPMPDCLAKCYLSEIASMVAPPRILKQVMECVMLILGENSTNGGPNEMHFTSADDGWGNIRRVMRNPKTLDRMARTNIDNITKPNYKKIHKIIQNNPKFNIEEASNVAPVCLDMMRWVLALYNNKRRDLKVSEGGQLREGIW